MRDILNLGLRLLIITMVATLCLTGTHLLTKDAIEQRNAESAAVARVSVLPGADAFEQLSLNDFPIGGDPAYDTLKEICRGTKDGETVGYVFIVTPNGYKAQIPVTLGIDSETGTIVGMEIGAIEETAGLGTRITEEPFLSQFTGLAARTGEVTQSVETISGATVSSRACVRAAELAATFFDTFLRTDTDSAPAASLDPYGVYAQNAAPFSREGENK